MAESIFRQKVRNAGLEDRIEIDSAGTGDWHVGQLPDIRTRNTLRRRGIDHYSHARQVRSQDFTEFDLIIAMDHNNARNLAAWRGADPDRIRMMMDYAGGELNREVPDPYYDGEDAFFDVFTMLDRACDGLLRQLQLETGVPQREL